MRSYELMLIVDASFEEEAIDAIIERTKSIVSGSGEVESVEKWGKRRLAFEIQDKTEGFYVVIDFKADNETTVEVERVLKITDGVFRHLLVRKEE